MEDLGDHADLSARAGDRLACVSRLELRESLMLLLDQHREPVQEAAPVGGGDGAPAGKRRFRPCDGGVGLLDARAFELGDRLLGGGVENGERHAADSTRSLRPVIDEAAVRSPRSAIALAIPASTKAP